MNEFDTGKRVMRREDRPIRGATVLAVAQAIDGPSYLIAYDEGGEGWWPQDAIEAEA